jgi:hypothetical protein
LIKWTINELFLNYSKKLLIINLKKVISWVSIYSKRGNFIKKESILSKINFSFGIIIFSFLITKFIKNSSKFFKSSAIKFFI